MTPNFFRVTIIAALAIGAMAWQASVQAADGIFDGSYIELRGGANFMTDADNSSGGSGPFATDTDFDTGFTVGLAIGYSFANQARYGRGLWNNVRVELEAGYNENDINGTATNAEISVNNYMFNAYYDFSTGGRLRPFIGGGVGVARVEVDGVSLSDDDDTVLAFQGRAGLSYEISRNFLISLGYRYLNTSDPDFRTSTGTSFESETESHAVEVGLRYKF